MVEYNLIAERGGIKKPRINQAEKLPRKSIDELKEIARLRRIKNRDKLTKEGLIISLLKSESSDAERNYMKHFTNYNTDGDNTYDGEISDIRMMLRKLGNTVTNNDRKKVKRKLYEIEKKENFQIRKKKRFMMILLN